MPVKQKLQEQKIYDILSRQKFAEWYGLTDRDDHSEFGNHLRGDENCKTKEEILAKIRDIFEDVIR
jgi:hypothetical protein